MDIMTWHYMLQVRQVTSQFKYKGNIIYFTTINPVELQHLKATAMAGRCACKLRIIKLCLTLVTRLIILETDAYFVFQSAATKYGVLIQKIVQLISLWKVEQVLSEVEIS